MEDGDGSTESSRASTYAAAVHTTKTDVFQSGSAFVWNPKSSSNPSKSRPLQDISPLASRGGAPLFCLS